VFFRNQTPEAAHKWMGVKEGSVSPFSGSQPLTGDAGGFVPMAGRRQQLCQPEVNLHPIRRLLAAFFFTHGQSGTKALLRRSGEPATPFHDSRQGLHVDPIQR
jgi:hypothetical protein